MRLWPDLTTRSESLERMDDRSLGGAELVEALRQLRWINGLLLGFLPSLEGVATLWRQAGRPPRLTLLDVGAGSGDANRMLLWWARLRGIDLHIVLVDIHPDTCRAAAAYYAQQPRVTVVQGDIFCLPFAHCDIVTAALVMHHFPAAQVQPALEEMLAVGRLGVVVNDLHRNAFAWLFIAAATRLLSRNQMIRSDAPLSVQRGFRRSDLQRLREQPALAALRFGWRPFFRYLVIVPGRDVQDAGGDGL